MNIQKFNKLSYTEQEEIVFNKGKYLENYVDRNEMYDAYELYDFYVAFGYNLKINLKAKITIHANADELPHLKKIHNIFS